MINLLKLVGLGKKEERKPTVNVTTKTNYFNTLALRLNAFAREKGYMDMDQIPHSDYEQIEAGVRKDLRISRIVYSERLSF